jgi:hypothetical protein
MAAAVVVAAAEGRVAPAVDATVGGRVEVVLAAVARAAIVQAVGVSSVTVRVRWVAANRSCRSA